MVKDTRSGATAETAVEHQDYPFRRNAGQELDDLVQRDRTGRQVRRVGVVRDQEEGVRAVRRVRDDYEVLFGNAAEPVLELTNDGGSGGECVGEHHHRLRT